MGRFTAARQSVLGLGRLGGRVKLVVQIPCFNEHDTIGRTIADLPRKLSGIETIEVLVVDDGSTDGTAEQAERQGAHWVVRAPKHRGLAIAFMAGIDAALRAGADLIVNTDADGQYRGSDIVSLIAPLLDGRADLVIGDRRTDQIAGFSPMKKLLQRWGSRTVRRLSATDVADSPSGFRAMTRNCALQLFVHNRFTYTLETVIQAGRRGLSVVNVPVTVNPNTRASRLFRSIPEYLGRAGPVLFRAYAMYRPVQLFGILIFALLLFGAAVGVRFLYHYLQDPQYSGYIQSLVVGTGAVILAFVLAVAALLSELLAANRRLLEEVLMRVRSLETNQKVGAPRAETLHTQRTAHPSWERGNPTPTR